MPNNNRWFQLLSLCLLPQGALFADHLGVAGPSYRSINSPVGSSVIAHVAMVVLFDDNGTVETSNRDHYLFWNGAPIAFMPGGIIESGTESENIATMTYEIGLPPAIEYITCSTPPISIVDTIDDVINANIRVGAATTSSNRWYPENYVTLWNTYYGGTRPYNIISNNCYSFVSFVRSQL